MLAAFSLPPIFLSLLILTTLALVGIAIARRVSGETISKEFWEGDAGRTIARLAWIGFFGGLASLALAVATYFITGIVSPA